jgi:hypothetical protein
MKKDYTIWSPRELIEEINRLCEPATFVCTDTACIANTGAATRTIRSAQTLAVFGNPYCAVCDSHMELLDINQS